MKRGSKLLGRQAWCVYCNDKRPPTMRPASFLIPVRENPYDLLKTGDRDFRVMGVCNECLPLANKFQQSNKEAVDINHPHLIHIK